MPKLASHLHLPVQSGSDRVLALMKRGYTALEFKEKVRKLRSVRPDICISSDFIVGFPGRERARFRGDARRSCATSASISRSASSTAAAPERRRRRFPDEMPGEVKQERLARLQAQLDAQAQRHQRAHGRHRAARAGRAACEEGRARARRQDREQPLDQLCRVPPRSSAASSTSRHRTVVTVCEAVAAQPARTPCGSNRSESHCASSISSRRTMRGWPICVARSMRTCACSRHASTCRSVGAATISGCSAPAPAAPRTSLQRALRPGRRTRKSRRSACIWRCASASPARNRADLDPAERGVRVPRGGIRARGAHQRDYLAHIRSRDLTFGIGPAGTGKTYLAVACAVEVAAGGDAAPHHPGAAGGRGRRAAGVSAGRPQRRRSIRICARCTTHSTRCWGSTGCRASSSATSSRSRRSLSCAAARSTIPSSFSTRRRTPPSSR